MLQQLLRILIHKPPLSRRRKLPQDHTCSCQQQQLSRSQAQLRCLFKQQLHQHLWQQQLPCQLQNQLLRQLPLTRYPQLPQNLCLQLHPQPHHQQRCQLHQGLRYQ